LAILAAGIISIATYRARFQGTIGETAGIVCAKRGTTTIAFFVTFAHTIATDVAIKYLPLTRCLKTIRNRHILGTHVLFGTGGETGVDGVDIAGGMHYVVALAVACSQ
jgi:hypothetical protein